MKQVPFALGTAQLGFDYGINNRGGRPAYETAREVVATAWRLGIRLFDTAHAYGDSEAVLGRIFQELSLSDSVLVQTKWDLNGVGDAEQVRNLFSETLERMRLSSLDTLYAHQFESYAHAPAAVLDTIGELLETGRLNRFGVSVYDPEEAFAAIDDARVTVVQIPGNAFDRRFEDSGFIPAAEARGVRVFVRSVYLQGMLVMNEDELPERFEFARGSVRAWREFCSANELEPSEFAVQYVAAKRWGTPVIGCESPQQVSDNIRHLQALETGNGDTLDAVHRWEEAAEGAILAEVCDPRKWPAAR